MKKIRFAFNYLEAANPNRTIGLMIPSRRAYKKSYKK